MPYVIRTDKLSQPHYFAGQVDGSFVPTTCITPTIFDAWPFADRAEAEALIADTLGDDWTISEMGEPKTSRNLRPAKPRGARKAGAL